MQCNAISQYDSFRLEKSEEEGRKMKKIKLRGGDARKIVALSAEIFEEKDLEIQSVWKVFFLNVRFEQNEL